MMSEPEIINTPEGPAQLRRSRRKTLAISVLPDGTLELVAPEHAQLDAILLRVAKRGAWIRTQRRTFREMNATRPTRRYVNGATHRYLGRQYRLKVRTGDAPAVKLHGAFLHVIARNIDEPRVRGLVNEWMRERALEHFTRRVQRWSEWCERHRLPQPSVTLLSMKKRWGSAHKNGRIALNPELIRAPSACVDYVIAHEVCHLKHPNHTPAYYRQLTQLLPDWRRIKDRLERAEL